VTFGCLLSFGIKNNEREWYTTALHCTSQTGIDSIERRLSKLTHDFLVSRYFLSRLFFDYTFQHMLTSSSLDIYKVSYCKWLLTFRRGLLIIIKYMNCGLIFFFVPMIETEWLGLHNTKGEGGNKHITL